MSTSGHLRSVKPPADYHGGLYSAGWSITSMHVKAFCQCGWSAATRRWGAGVGPLVKADLDAHLAESGHTAFPDGFDEEGFGRLDRWHLACGYFHDFQDACPAPYDSPRGRLERAMQATVSDPTAALDRLAAIDELRKSLDEQEEMAVIGARMARVTWAEMGQAVGTSRQGAFNRWGAAIKRYEAAGLVDAVSEEEADVPIGEWVGGIDPTLATQKAMEIGIPGS